MSLVQTFIKNTGINIRRVTYRQGCAIPLKPGESKVLPGAPFEFNNPREVTSLQQLIDQGQIEISYVIDANVSVLDPATAAKAVEADRNKILKNITKKAAKAGKVAPPPAPPKVTVNTTVENEKLINSSKDGDVTIDNHKPEIKHTVGSKADQPKEPQAQPTVEVFSDRPMMTKDATKLVEKNKLTREDIAKIKPTGNNGEITLADVEAFLDSMAGISMSKTAEKLAKDNGLTADEIKSIEGTGKEGSITKPDVQKFIDNKG
jgi:hypothetical protein